MTQILRSCRPFLQECRGASGRKCLKGCFWPPGSECPKTAPSSLGRTRKGTYSTRGRSRHPSGNSLLRTPSENPSQNPFYCKTHRRPPSQNPSENPFPRTLPRTFSEPFSERCVAVRPLRRAPYSSSSESPKAPDKHPGVGAFLGNEKCARTFFWYKLFEHPQASGTSPQKSQDIPDSSFLDTEYDRAKVPPYNGNDPRPW